jgi:hypothetical protein
MVHLFAVDLIDLTRRELISANAKINVVFHSSDQ